MFHVEAFYRARITPAGAGKTRTSRSCWRHTRVHPRWRGEDASTQRLPITRNGSPPLPRGRHLPTRPFMFSYRVLGTTSSAVAAYPITRSATPTSAVP